jgi:hypothetical protein
MPISRKARVVLILLLLILALGALSIWRGLRWFEKAAVGFHQKSVTRSLAAWGDEYANITNDASAIHAAEVITYMDSYYVPGPGYRGPTGIEAALEMQRRKSIERVAASLERYTGSHYGTNVKRWSEWAKGRKSSESHGMANGNEPTGSHTNRTSPLQSGSQRNP